MARSNLSLHPFTSKLHDTPFIFPKSDGFCVKLFTATFENKWRMPGFFSLTMRGTWSCSLAQMITAIRLPGAVPLSEQGFSGGGWSHKGRLSHFQYKLYTYLQVRIILNRIGINKINRNGTNKTKGLSNKTQHNLCHLQWEKLCPSLEVLEALHVWRDC